MRPDHNPDNVADRNVQRLLTGAYEPEVPDPAFVEKATAAMHAAAGQQAYAPALRRSGRPVWRLAGWTVAAALLVGVGVLLSRAVLVSPDRRAAPIGAATPQPAKPIPKVRTIEPVRVVTQSRRPTGSTGLIAQARAKAPAPATLVVGDSLETAAGQRRRVVLDDGSVLYLNQQTAVTLDRSRHVTLHRGEVYVEVAPQAADQSAGGEPAARFVVATPDRRVTALGTKFNVRLTDRGTGVVVTQGKVQVSGMKLPILAGQQLAPAGYDPEQPVSAAPRATHVIDWTRDLMARAESPLVPGSKYAGGALVAADPNGQDAKLSLRKYHVDVHVEDGFARTTIDQTYFNHLTSRLEGTFYFPLPPDASLSRLAMYVNGKLMEGGMAERDHARRTFEDIVRKMKDPALLEWIDGSTFKMRVFPLEPRQEKRIVLSYTQRLPSIYNKTEYRFPGGHNMQQVGRWSARLRVVGGAEKCCETGAVNFKRTVQNHDLVLETQAENVRPDRDVTLTLWDGDVPFPDEPPMLRRPSSVSGTPSPQPSPGGRGRFATVVHEGSKYLMLRWRPQLPEWKPRERRDWIFLFEASADRDPLLARVQVDVIRTLLENAEHDDTFSILTAGTRVHAFAEKPRPASPKNVRRAVKFLDRTHLVGALDLGRAMAAAEPLIEAAENPYLVHVGSGLPVLGVREASGLLRRIPDSARYVGVAVGKRWSRTLMKAAADRSGGHFTQINPDEQVTWRAMDLLATLNTPRLLKVGVVDGADALSFLCHNDSLADGEELCAVTRMEDGRPLPQSVEVTGTFEGKPRTTTIAVEAVTRGADYLPRIWAKLEIDRLVALGAVEHKVRIIELSKAMYVMSPFTSLLVLENEEMYRQYNIDRGRKDHWALYPCPEEIPVVHEPLPSRPASGTAKTTGAERPNVRQVLKTILVRIPPPLLSRPNRARYPAGLTAPVLTFYNGRQAFVVQAHDLDGDGGWRYDPRAWYSNAVIGWQNNTDFDTLLELITPTIPPATWGEAGSWTSATTWGTDLDAPDFQNMRLPTFSFVTVPTTVRVPDGGTVLLGGIRAMNDYGDYLLPSFHQPSLVNGVFGNGYDEYVNINALPLLRRVSELNGLDLPGLGAFAEDFSRQRRVIELEQRNQQRAENMARAKEPTLTNEDLLRKQEKVEQLMQRFNSLMDEERFDEAKVVAKRAVEFDPENPFAQQMQWQSKFVRRFRANRAMQEAAKDGFWTQMDAVARSAVPFPNEPPIVYPSAEVWQELTARRRERYSSMDLGTGRSVTVGMPDPGLFSEEGRLGLDFEDIRLHTRVYPVADLLLPIRSGLYGYGPMGLLGLSAEETGLYRGVYPVANLMLPIQAAAKARLLRHFGSKPEPSLYPGPPDVEGVVLSVIDNKLCEVSVGSDDGLEVGHELQVVRHSGGAGTYVGKLKVVKTDADRSVCVNDTKFMKSRLQIGDRVFSRLGERQPPAPNKRWTELHELYDRHVRPVLLAHEIQAGRQRQVVAYQKPSFRNNWSVYYDLLSYAPGMNTGRADVAVVLEAEVEPRTAPTPGKIDEKARTLIEKARGAGWQTATIANKKGKLLLSVDFDGTGRYRYERTTHRGLREQVLSDGASLWHLYPELGLGARRTLSRFHRRALGRLIPWTLPPAENLARSADLKAVDERSVALVPRGVEKLKDDKGKPLPYVRVHLVFAPEGRLAERQLVAIPKEEVLLRQTYAADGSIAWLDADDELLAEWKIDLKPCGAPELKPDAGRLVILPLPLRRRDRVQVEGCENWSEDEALEKIANSLTIYPHGAREIILRRFFSRGDRRLGFYPLLVAGGHHWDPNVARQVDEVPVAWDPLADHPEEALARYIDAYLKLRQGKQEEFGPIGDERNGLLGQLAEFRDLWTCWSDDKADRRELDRALEFVRDCRWTELGWALLSTMRNVGGNQEFHRRTAAAAEVFEKVPGLAYTARYERARATLNAGDWQQAQELFTGLYEDVLKLGLIPPIEERFYQAFQHGDGQKRWRKLILQTGARLIAAGNRATILRLARRVHQLGDGTLADELFRLATGVIPKDEHLGTTLAAVEYLWHTGRKPRADARLQPLLEHERYARWPSLWRLASAVAEKRGMTARAAGYLERAMEIEYAAENLDETVQLERLRNDHGNLLSQYAKLAAAIATLQQDPPRELLGRVIHVVDRWRTLDPEPTAACHAAAKIFGDLGAADLAWDYLTTPLAAGSHEAAPWLDLAEMLRQQAQFDLADRAYASAFETEPHNAQILWDRAQVLLEAGRTDEARRLFGQLARGEWEPKFDQLKSRAAQHAEKR